MSAHSAASDRGPTTGWHRAEPGAERAGAPGQEGVAIVFSLFFAIDVMGHVITGTTVLTANKQKTEASFHLHSQARQFARSGLTESLAWYRRQTSQPVLKFEPLVDPLATPPVLDTDEPEIGIVREFKIGGTVWGRYEVWKQWDADPDPERLAFRKQMQARDVSLERNLGALGTAWRLRCAGYVFRRTDPNARFDETPNHVIATHMLETEILRLKISPPGQAAVCIEIASDCTVDVKARVRGGTTGAGVFCRQGTGTPGGAGTITGTPGVAPMASYSGSLAALFGSTLADLEAIADDVITTPADFPDLLPTNGLVIANAGALTFTATKPLRGTCILYVKGDVTMRPGNNSSFSGLLYVDGNLRIEAPTDITGTVIIGVGGTLSMIGAGDWATIDYDQDVLDVLRREIGQYRMAGAIRNVHTGE